MTSKHRLESTPQGRTSTFTLRLALRHSIRVPQGNRNNQETRTRGPARNIASDVVFISQQARNLKGLVLLMAEIAVIGRDI